MEYIIKGGLFIWDDDIWSKMESSDGGRRRGNVMQLKCIGGLYVSVCLKQHKAWGERAYVMSPMAPAQHSTL